jgi:hypothetical protein
VFQSTQVVVLSSDAARMRVLGDGAHTLAIMRNEGYAETGFDGWTGMRFAS